MKNLALSLMAVVCLAIPAAAAEPFVALVDMERGLLLIPEGTAVPKGVEFLIERDLVREALTADGDVAPAEPRRFVYAYAPAEKFAAARQRIGTTEAEWPEMLVEDDGLGPMAVADMDQTYYYYFSDGSWHGARKYIRNIAFNDVQYGVATQAFTSNGDFDSKVTASQSSAQNSFWNVTKTCWFYGVDGTCSIPIHASHRSSTFTASATSSAYIVHYLYPPCDLPCKENYSSSIVINFP